MPNKSTLTSTINGYITALITQAKLRSGFLEVINSLFQTTTYQADTTGSNKFLYDLRYKKIGNIVYLDGTITNAYSIAKTTCDILTIPDSLFYAKTSFPTLLSINSTLYTPIRLKFEADKIKLDTSMQAGQVIYINAHYQTND
jgi:hypothetical protein